MNLIEKQAFYTYQSNLFYLQQEHPNLYTQITALSAGIESGEFEENYLLEYKDEKYFDIYSVRDECYLYNQDSNKFTKNILDKIKLDEFTNAFHTLFKNQQIIPSYEFLEETFSYINKHKKDDKTYKIIPKFFFLGTLLGLHILPIIEKLSIKRCFIYEYNIEIFRLSLFIVPYSEIAKYTKLTFSILEDDIEFKKNFSTFLANWTNLNYAIKFFSLPIYENLFKSIEAMVLSNQAYRMDFLRRLNTYRLSIEKMTDKNHLLNLHQCKDILSDKPVIIVGAGPSLDKNIQWLQENKDKFIVISVGATLPTLLKNGIKPDISTEIHPELDILDTYENIDLEEIKDIIFLAGAQIPKELLEKYTENISYIFFNSYIIKDHLGVVAGQSVGNVTLNLTLFLGAKEVYLLGLDFGISDEGKTHSDSHVHTRQLEKKEQDDLSSRNYMCDASIFKVKGNLRETVNTNPLFYAFLENANNTTQHLKDDVNIYNLSDGAYIDNTIPLDAKKCQIIETIKKDLFKNTLIERLNNVSEIGIKQKDIETIKDTIKHLDEIINVDLDPDTDLRVYFKEVLKNGNLDGAYKEMIANFIRIIFHYVDDFLNDSTFSSKRQTKHINNLNKLLYNQFITLTERYRDLLKSILNKKEE